MALPMAWASRQQAIVHRRQTTRQWIELQGGKLVPYSERGKLHEVIDDRLMPVQYRGEQGGASSVNAFRMHLGDEPIERIYLRLPFSPEECQQILNVFPESEIAQSATMKVSHEKRMQMMKSHRVPRMS
ncbi:MAG: hypothetical protein KF708_22775, partial [Pirellulales bacterium]|nr:hypothetical protein [Pirellulales bacterium]